MGLIFGFGLPTLLFLGWLGWLWSTTRNPVGLNWAYLISDSAYYPGSMVWRTYSFDLEKTDVWRRLFGSVIRGVAYLVSQGPLLCGAAIAGVLGLFSAMHSFRRTSATSGKLLLLAGAGSLLVATAFIVRDGA